MSLASSYKRLARWVTVLVLAFSLPGCTGLPATPTVLPKPAAPTADFPTAVPSSTPGPVPSTALPAAAPTSTAAARPQPEYLVLISIDGCRPEYFDLADMPNLQSLRASGMYYADAWVGALENNTPTGHTMMSTGSFPKRNGIPGYKWADLAAGEVYEPTTEEAVNAGEMNNIVSRSGVPTLAGLFKQRFPDGMVISVSARKFYAAQALGFGPADVIVYSHPNDETGLQYLGWVDGYEPDADLRADPRLTGPTGQLGQDNTWALTTARILFEHDHPRALLVNLPETDVQGHRTGGLTAPSVIRSILETTDRGLGELIQAYRDAGIYDQTLWVITADHGMTPKEDLLVADDLFTGLSIEAEPGDLLNLPEAWLVQPARAPEIAIRLAGSGTPGITAVYTRGEKEGQYTYQLAGDSGSLPPGLEPAYRYLLDTFASRFSPNLVAMTAEGVVFDKDLNGTGGAHNEINWANQHIFAIFSGPGVLPGVSYAPARLVDLAPTIARLMALGLGGMDGVVLADALQSPLPEDVTAQRESDAQIAPLRDALEAQSLR